MSSSASSKLASGAEHHAATHPSDTLLEGRHHPHHQQTSNTNTKNRAKGSKSKRKSKSKSQFSNNSAGLPLDMRESEREAEEYAHERERAEEEEKEIDHRPHGVEDTRDEEGEEEDEVVEHMSPRTAERFRRLRQRVSVSSSSSPPSAAKTNSRNDIANDDFDYNDEVHLHPRPHPQQEEEKEDEEKNSSEQQEVNKKSATEEEEEEEKSKSIPSKKEEDEINEDDTVNDKTNKKASSHRILADGDEAHHSVASPSYTGYPRGGGGGVESASVSISSALYPSAPPNSVVDDMSMMSSSSAHGGGSHKNNKNVAETQQQPPSSEAGREHEKHAAAAATTTTTAEGNDGRLLHGTISTAAPAPTIDDNKNKNNNNNTNDNSNNNNNSSNTIDEAIAAASASADESYRRYVRERDAIRQRHKSRNEREEIIEEAMRRGLMSDSERREVESMERLPQERGGEKGGEGEGAEDEDEDEEIMAMRQIAKEEELANLRNVAALSTLTTNATYSGKLTSVPRSTAIVVRDDAPPRRRGNSSGRIASPSGAPASPFYDDGLLSRDEHPLKSKDMDSLEAGQNANNASAADEERYYRLLEQYYREKYGLFPAADSAAESISVDSTTTSSSYSSSSLSEEAEYKNAMRRDTYGKGQFKEEEKEEEEGEASHESVLDKDFTYASPIDGGVRAFVDGDGRFYTFSHNQIVEGVPRAVYEEQESGRLFFIDDDHAFVFRSGNNNNADFDDVLDDEYADEDEDDEEESADRGLVRGPTAQEEQVEDTVKNKNDQEDEDIPLFTDEELRGLSDEQLYRLYLLSKLREEEQEEQKADERDERRMQELIRKYGSGGSGSGVGSTYGGEGAAPASSRKEEDQLVNIDKLSTTTNYPLSNTSDSTQQQQHHQQQQQQQQQHGLPPQSVRAESEDIMRSERSKWQPTATLSRKPESIDEEVEEDDHEEDDIIDRKLAMSEVNYLSYLRDLQALGDRDADTLLREYYHCPDPATRRRNAFVYEDGADAADDEDAEDFDDDDEDYDTARQRAFDPNPYYSYSLSNTDNINTNNNNSNMAAMNYGPRSIFSMATATGGQQINFADGGHGLLSPTEQYIYEDSSVVSDDWFENARHRDLENLRRARGTYAVGAYDTNYPANSDTINSFYYDVYNDQDDDEEAEPSPIIPMLNRFNTLNVDDYTTIGEEEFFARHGDEGFFAGKEMTNADAIIEANCVDEKDYDDGEVVVNDPSLVAVGRAMDPFAVRNAGGEVYKGQLLRPSSFAPTNDRNEYDQAGRAYIYSTRRRQGGDITDDYAKISSPLLVFPSSLSSPYTGYSNYNSINNKTLTNNNNSNKPYFWPSATTENDPELAEVMRRVIESNENMRLVMAPIRPESAETIVKTNPAVGFIDREDLDGVGPFSSVVGGTSRRHRDPNSIFNNYGSAIMDGSAEKDEGEEDEGDIRNSKKHDPLSAATPYQRALLRRLGMKKSAASSPTELYQKLNATSATLAKRSSSGTLSDQIPFIPIGKDKYGFPLNFNQRLANKYRYDPTINSYVLTGDFGAAAAESAASESFPFFGKEYSSKMKFSSPTPIAGHEGPRTAKRTHDKNTNNKNDNKANGLNDSSSMLRHEDSGSFHASNSNNNNNDNNDNVGHGQPILSPHNGLVSPTPYSAQNRGVLSPASDHIASITFVEGFKEREDMIPHDSAAERREGGINEPALSGGVVRLRPSQDLKAKTNMAAMAAVDPSSSSAENNNHNNNNNNNNNNGNITSSLATMDDDASRHHNQSTLLPGMADIPTAIVSPSSPLMTREGVGSASNGGDTANGTADHTTSRGLTPHPSSAAAAAETSRSATLSYANRPPQYKNPAYVDSQTGSVDTGYIAPFNSVDDTYLLAKKPSAASVSSARYFYLDTNRVQSNTPAKMRGSASKASASSSTTHPSTKAKASASNSARSDTHVAAAASGEGKKRYENAARQTKKTEKRRLEKRGERM